MNRHRSFGTGAKLAACGAILTASFAAAAGLAAMAFSSVFVVTNSLRLRRFQPAATSARRA